MLQAEAHVGIGGEMKNRVAPGHCRSQRGQVEIVAFDELEIFVLKRAVEKFSLAGGKIVPADDGFALRQQAVHEVAADKSSGAGDKNDVHV